MVMGKRQPARTSECWQVRALGAWYVRREKLCVADYFSLSEPYSYPKLFGGNRYDRNTTSEVHVMDRKSSNSVDEEGG